MRMFKSALRAATTQQRLGMNQLFGQPCLLCQLNPPLSGKSVCAACWHTLPWYRQTIQNDQLPIEAICHYTWPVDRLIHLYKYQERLDLLPLLSDILLTVPKPSVQALVPVPISNQKMKIRGFNQTLLLTQHLSHIWQIPIWQPLSRQHTPAQQGLSRQERLVNVQEAFYINPKQCKIIPRRILLLDDVVTTGSTLNSMARLLATLNVQHITGLVIAHASS